MDSRDSRVRTHQSPENDSWELLPAHIGQVQHTKITAQSHVRGPKYSGFKFPIECGFWIQTALLKSPQTKTKMIQLFLDQQKMASKITVVILEVIKAPIHPASLTICFGPASLEDIILQHQQQHTLDIHHV